MKQGRHNQAHQACIKKDVVVVVVVKALDIANNERE